MARYEDLDAFKAAIELMVEVYRTTSGFPKQEQYGLVVQMRKASISVISHIAEGQGRLSFGEWRQMLSQARGSLFEVEAQTIASSKLGFLSDDATQELRTKVRDTAKPLGGLIKFVERQERTAKLKSDSKPQTANGKLPSN